MIDTCQKVYIFTSMGTFLTGEWTAKLIPETTPPHKKPNSYSSYSELRHWWLKALQVTLFDTNIIWTLRLLLTRKCPVKIYLIGVQKLLWDAALFSLMKAYSKTEDWSFLVWGENKFWNLTDAVKWHHYLLDSYILNTFFFIFAVSKKIQSNAIWNFWTHNRQ